MKHVTIAMAFAFLVAACGDDGDPSGGLTRSTAAQPRSTYKRHLARRAWRHISSGSGMRCRRVGVDPSLVRVVSQGQPRPHSWTESPANRGWAISTADYARMSRSR